MLEGAHAVGNVPPTAERLDDDVRVEQDSG